MSAPSLVAAQQPPEAAPWTFGRRMAFRFVFGYWILYTFPVPFGGLPFAEGLGRALTTGRKILVPWFGRHVLHLSAPAVWHPTGSGDTLYDWSPSW